MNTAELLARIDSYARPLLSKGTPHFITKFYSHTRKFFLDSFFNASFEKINVTDSLSVTLGGLTFRSPIFNAAGMFKNAEGYELCYALGAGAYLAGTTTSQKRYGNKKNGITLPFCPYPKSMTASNWLGLPNEGHTEVAKRIGKLKHYKNFPIGISVAADPGMDEEQSLPLLLDGLKRYTDSGVHFIELNESCPNTENRADSSIIDENLIRRLEYISTHFIGKQQSKTPVFLKFSNDILQSQLHDLFHRVQQMGFGGINIGNTSVRYKEIETLLSPDEIKTFRYFYTNFGGGTSGKVLNKISLQLCQTLLKEIENNKDFVIIRTGGVLSAMDIKESQVNNIALNQWYTGFFENFGHHGREVYSHLYNQL